MKFSKHLMLELESRELHDCRANVSVPLSMAELEILKLLAQHIGDVVSKEDLTEAGWPKRVVAPSSLTQCISHLRRKIENHDDIELKTIPRYGYSLCIIEAEKVNETANAVSSSAEQQGLNTPADLSYQPQQASAQNAFAKPVWRNQWLILGLCLLTLAGLHFFGVLKKSVNYFSLLNVPSVESVKSNEFRLANKRVEYSQVRIEGQPKVVRELAHFVNNWANTQALLTGDSLKKVFVNDNQRYESVALCNEFDGECSDIQPLNLVRDSNTFAPLDLEWLANTKLRMEQVTYNNILLDKFDGPAEGLTEDIYRADVYYYGQSKNVVRADVRLSLVYEGPDRGKLYAAACITDDLLREVSIRYQFSGDFKMQESQVDGQTVKSFIVNAEDRSFTSPQEISKQSATIYREIRKKVLTEENMVLRQVYSDEHSGVWVLPLWGDTIVWAHRVAITL